MATAHAGVLRAVTDALDVHQPQPLDNWAARLCHTSFVRYDGMMKGSTMVDGGITWGSIADWVSGLGSLFAGVIALYLARASERIRLNGYVGVRLAGGGMPTVELGRVIPFLIHKSN